MASRFLYQGIHSAFTRNTGTVANSTSGSGFNATYCDSYVRLAESPPGVAIADFTTGDGTDDYVAAGERLDIRADIFMQSSGGATCDALVLLNNADQQLVKLAFTSAFTLRLYFNSGTLATPVWTQIGSNISHASTAVYTYVLRIGIDPAGTAHTYELFFNGSSLFSGTFNMPLLTRIDAARFASGANVNLGVSQVLAAADMSLVGSFVSALKATGAGSSSGMTGGAADVNEVVLSDATVVSSDTVAQRTTLAISDLPTLTGLVVANEVRHTFRANNDGGAGPQNLKPVIRQSGADTVGSVISGLNTGYKAFTAPYSLTQAQINAAGFELGWESDT